MKHLPVAPEGWFYIFLSAGCACLISFHFKYVSIVFWILFLLILNFFRDPERRSGQPDSAVIAPADGKIIFIGKGDLDAPFATYRKVSIFMNIFDVHVNRAPVSGRVRSIRHFPGRYISANKESASRENERVEIVINSKQGPVLVRLVAGFIARRIVCKMKEGEKVSREQRIGMIKFGSRVDLYLPPNTRIEIGMGDRTKAGNTVIGTFIESQRS